MRLRACWNSANLSPVSTWRASLIPSTWWLQMCPAESYSPGRCRWGSLQRGRWGESRQWCGTWLKVNAAPAALVIPPLLTALFRSNPSKADVLSPTPFRPITVEITAQGGRARASDYFGVQNPLVISPWLADPVLEGGSRGKQALQNAISVKWQLPQQQGKNAAVELIDVLAWGQYALRLRLSSRLAWTS